MTLADASRSALDLALQLLHEPTGNGRVYKTDRDYATQTDHLIEDRVRAHLVRLTPEIGFLGEERGHTGATQRYWCLDPIDGTTNYSRGLPSYGIALALIEDGQPVAGEIALPAHHERYVARGGSAYLNGQSIGVAQTSDLSDAIVAVGDFATGGDSVEKNRQRLATIGHLADRVGRVRMLGSAATDLAWIAAGRIDAVVMHSNHPWDLAAGIALARAAGAAVTDHQGEPYSLDSPNVLVAAPGVHGGLVAATSRGDQSSDCETPRVSACCATSKKVRSAIHYYDENQRRYHVSPWVRRGFTLVTVAALAMFGMVGPASAADSTSDEVLHGVSDSAEAEVSVHSVATPDDLPDSADVYELPSGSLVAVVPERDGEIQPHFSVGVGRAVYIYLNKTDQKALVNGGAAALGAAVCAVPAVGAAACAAVLAVVAIGATYLSANGLCPASKPTLELRSAGFGVSASAKCMVR